MKTFRRTLPIEKAQGLKKAFELCNARFRTLGDTVVKGYRYKLTVYSYQGGDEWSPKRKVEQFTVYYN